MEKVQELSRRLFAFRDGNSFMQTRYLLGTQDPCGMGDLSLGYSNGQLRVYWTKYVGEKGVIDLDIEDLLRVIRECISTCSPFRTDVANLIQNIANQFMPGLHTSLPFLGTNVFLRPHVEGLQVGFALIFYKSWSSADLLYNTLRLPIPSPEVFKNIGEQYPFVTFVNRSVHDDVSIGCIRCGLFISQHVNGGVYSEFSIRFLFNSPFGANVGRMAQHLRKDATDQNVIGPVPSGDSETVSGGNGTTYSEERGNESRSGGGGGSGGSSGKEDGKGGKHSSSSKKTSGQEETTTTKESESNEKDKNSSFTDKTKKALIATSAPTTTTTTINKNMFHTTDIKWKILPFTLVGMAMSLKGFYRLPYLGSFSKI